MSLINKNISALILTAVIIQTSCQTRDTKKNDLPVGSPDTNSKVITKAAPGKETTVNISPVKEDFPSFWARFRTATVNFDTSQIMNMTEFPFETRGMLDDDEVIEYGRSKFIRFYKIYLNQTVWGTDTVAQTEFDYIKNDESLKQHEAGKEQARVSNLVFDRTASGWKATFAYLEDDTIDSLAKVFRKEKKHK